MEKKIVSMQKMNIPDNITDGAKMASAEITETPKYITILTEHLSGTDIAINTTPGDTATDYLSAARITPGDEIKEPDAILYLSGARVFSRGDISAIVGAAKSRKTLFATAICNHLLRWSRDSWINTDLKNDIKILYIDTEQSRYHAQRTLNRILQGVPLTKDSNLYFYSMREFSPAQRLETTCKAIDQVRPDFVCIDGVADLIPDTNSNTDAPRIIGVLMAMAAAYDCHITSVLHTSAANNNKGRGHVGSELERKSESVILVKRDTNDFNKSIAEPQHTRNKPFEKMEIAHTDDGNFSLLPAVKETINDRRKRIITRAAEMATADAETAPQMFENNGYMKSATIKDYICRAYAEIEKTDCEDRTLNNILNFGKECERIETNGEKANKLRYKFTTPPPMESSSTDTDTETDDNLSY